MRVGFPRSVGQEAPAVPGVGAPGGVVTEDKLMVVGAMV